MKLYLNQILENLILNKILVVFNKIVKTVR